MAWPRASSPSWSSAPRDLGYPRLYLTTGPRQPEAVGLYLRAGYTPLFDPAAEATGPLPFEKWLEATS